MRCGRFSTSNLRRLLATRLETQRVHIQYSVHQCIIGFNPQAACSPTPDEHGGSYVRTLEKTHSSSAATGMGMIDVEIDASDWVVGSVLRDKHIHHQARPHRVCWTSEDGTTRTRTCLFHRCDGNGVFRGVGGGISGSFLQRGCSGQGDPSFSLIKPCVSTWCHGDVLVDGKLHYKNLRTHTVLY
jgi:hypothetical protein